MGLSWAYTPSVPTSGRGDRPAARRTGDAGKRRRRPPSQPEQARRKAWGLQWGSILKEHAQTYRRKV